jgi:PhzF family phenazine biosynthesis protein
MRLKLVFNEVSAFTRKGRPVLGNPAALCVVDEFPAQEAMERAAKELGRPMTSFLRRTADPDIFDIRHFSPDGKENHVCGHATLAAAEFLAAQAPGRRDGREITFRLNPAYAINAGNAFRARIDGDAIALTVPAVTELERVDDPAFYKRLAEALRVDEAAIVRPAYYAPRIINYVVELKDENTLLAMKPDFAKLKALAASAAFPHEGIMATVKSETQRADILTRVFLPIIDVDEDIACGSANCSVVPYWTMKRPGAFPPGKTAFRGLFPYPPGGAMLGGVQDLRIDHAKKEIVITGQAAQRGTIKVVLDMPRRGPKPL